MGSAIPASSPLFTASSYVAPTTTTLLSSSESTIQESNGAERRALTRGESMVAGTALPPSSPWRNPFFLSDGSDNGDSGSFEMDEAAEGKNKGLCYRCTSGSA